MCTVVGMSMCKLAVLLAIWLDSWVNGSKRTYAGHALPPSTEQS